MVTVILWIYTEIAYLEAVLEYLVAVDIFRQFHHARKANDERSRNILKSQ